MIGERDDETEERDDVLYDEELVAHVSEGS